jgi:hypothetical protein
MAPQVSEFITWRFEKRVVAFLDVLGFKELIRNAERDPSGLSKLNGLQTVIESHVRWDNGKLDPNVPKEMHPRYLFVSDSIILSAPLEHDGYSGLAVVALKSLQIAQKLLEMGLLIRGAISVGPVLHEEHNIFGTGYSSAYLAQEKACHPHIFMTAEAKTCFANAVHRGANLNDLGIWADYKGERVVDVFHPSYLRGVEAFGGLEAMFLQFEAFIHQSLLNLPAGSSARGKWEWIAMFYNAALKRHGIDTVAGFTEFPIPIQ